MLARRASGGDAQARLRLGEVKALGAVDEHRGRGLADVEAAGVDLADVGDEIGFAVPGGRQERSKTTQQLAVGDGLQIVDALHTRHVSTST